jgi:DNA-binding MarR family transcriptional regulator
LDTPHRQDEIDYAALAELRFMIRRFLAFSEAAAGKAGLTAQQHQALLAIKGFGGTDGLLVGALAERLLVRQNTAVELVNRLVKEGLAQRSSDPTDRRRVPVALTPLGEKRLAALTEQHQAEWHVLGPTLAKAIQALGPPS